MRSLKEWHEKSVKIEEGLRYLHLLANDARLFTDNHPKFQDTLRVTHEFWSGLLSEMDAIEIKQIGQDLIYEDVPLGTSLKSTQEVSRSFQERGMESLVFTPGLTIQELTEYAHYMRLSEQHRSQVGSPSVYFVHRGVTHIQCYRLGDMRDDEARREAERQAKGLPVAMKDLSAFRCDALKTIQNLYLQAKVANVLDLDTAQGLVDVFLRESIMNSTTLLGLCAIRTSDEYTSTHSMNTCLLSLSLARYLGVPDDKLPMVGIACLFHDIGKMFIPDAILNKPGKLTPEEWGVMQSHTVLGARFLLSVPNIPTLAPLVAFEHHMNPEGTGYPCPKRDYKTNLISYAASVADFYDALSTARSYKKAISPEKVVDIMLKLEEGKMEPRLKRQFLRMVGTYPIGSVVRLDTGELAVVRRQNPEDSLRPCVQLVTAPDGTPLTQSVAAYLTETRDGGIFVRSVSEGVDPTEVQIDALGVLQEILDADRLQ